MFHIVKALCYILLYQYLEEQKEVGNGRSSNNSSRNLHHNNRAKSIDSIKVNETINHRSHH